MSTSQPEKILETNRTVWQCARAERAAVLVDAGEYFGALRNAMQEAEDSIVVLGWDIDSRTRLVGPSGGADDGAPEDLLGFLKFLVRRRPNLDIRLLLWDYSILYALEREPLPSLNLTWRTPRQVRVALDNCLPWGACHHQKLVVVDGVLAFCGGIDLAVRRWDNATHDPGNPRRVDPDGKPYPPFHDLQMAVDGDAARALARLAAERWNNATDDATEPAEGKPIWPKGVAPDFEDVDIGVARTMPAVADGAAVREVEALYLESIRAATRHIYIENQYVTADSIADAMVERLREVPELEIVAVTPRLPGGWLEAQTMGAAQERFMEKVAQDGLQARVRFLYPWVGGSDHVPVMVHAKLMIVDDRLLRIGSSNLNRRSMGVDSECDLAIEAITGPRRREIRDMLCRRVGEHLGRAAGEVDAELQATGSLVATCESLGGEERGFAPVDSREFRRNTFTDALNVAADPEQPLRPDEFIGDMFDARVRQGHVRRLLRLSIVGGLLLAMVMAWQYTPLAELADPQVLAERLRAMRGQWWVYPGLLGAFIVGSIVLFPVTVLIALTGLMLGPLTGFLWAMVGSVTSGLIGHWIGRHTGARLIRSLSGGAFRAVARGLQNRGVIAVAALRMVPVGPFTVVNIVMGAAGVRAGAFAAGTVLGLTPGTLALTALGDRLREAWSDPDPANVGLFVLVLAAWLGLALALQKFVAVLRKRLA